MTLAPPHHPPRPRSPAQREAARRNGARSKGPVTAEGKARSARNALRHGLCSPAILFPGEDPAHFEALRAALEAEYAPGSPSARLLVERLAVTVWKLARCDRLEARLATIEPHCPTGRLFPDPGLPRVLSRIPELATLLRWQAQLDRQLYRLTKSLAEHARCASPSGDPAPGEDGPAADGEPAPPAPPEALLRPAEAAPARDTDEAVAPDGTTGCADPPTEPEAGDVGLARRPAFSATEAGCPPTARPERPNEAEAEDERVAAPATPPGRRAGPEGRTGTAEPGVRVPGPGPDASANFPNEPEAVVSGPDGRTTAHPPYARTGLDSAGTTRRDPPNEPEHIRAAPGRGTPVDPVRQGPAVACARNAAPNLPNEPEPGMPAERRGPAWPENGAGCAGADVRDRRRAEARVPDAALPTPTPQPRHARGAQAGYQRARSSASPRHPPATAPSAGPPRATPPPSHPPPRGKPGP
jgi:hypothetical protein